jgi:hypothetical protein
MKKSNMATGAGGGKQRPTEQQKTTPTKTTPTKKTK